MRRSNREASGAALAAGVRCATDVTGFGLLGHLREVAAASGLGAWIDPERVPVLDGALELSAAGHATGGGGRNRAALEGAVAIDGAVPDALAGVARSTRRRAGACCWPCRPGASTACVDALRAAGAGAHEVGLLHAGDPGRIAVGGPRPA